MTNRLDQNQSGVILVLMPFVIVTLFAALGMVVDSTNLYAAKVKAGAAAEQGVLSAIGSHISESDLKVKDQFAESRSNEKSYLRNRFEISAQNNLLQNGIVVPERSSLSSYLSTKLANDLSGDIVFEEDPVSARLRMTGQVSLEVPVFFKGVYDFVAQGEGRTSNIVTAFATGELRGNAFILILDGSASQGCPSEGSCTCRSMQRAGSCRDEANANNSRIRIEDIKEATEGVLKGLDRVRDRVSVIIYNNAAKILFSSGSNPGFNLNAALDSIDTVGPEDSAAENIPNGNTNVSDAVLLARTIMSGLNDPDLNGRKNVVLLTDGSPTAMRISPAASPLQDSGSSFVTFQLSRPLNDGSISHFPGPLIPTTMYRPLVNAVNRASPMTPVSISGNKGYEDDILPNCHKTSKTVGQGEQTKTIQIADPRLFSEIEEERVNGLNRCLKMSWKESSSNGFNSAEFGVDDSMKLGSAVDFRQMYYLAAVQAVENISSDGVRLYTLSWGPLDDGSGADLFNYESVAGVKHDFLRNLANDTYGVDQENPNWDRWSNPQFARLFGDTQRGFQAKAQRGAPKGGTFVAPDAEALKSLFKKIIILAKLSVVDVRAPHELN